jgi:hypothetical protein
MRLLHTRLLEIVEFMSDNTIPPYAILSHTWADDECTLQDMKPPKILVNRKIGYKKIKHCCDQARIDGYEWAWVDT